MDHLQALYNNQVDEASSGALVTRTANHTYSPYPAWSVWSVHVQRVDPIHGTSGGEVPRHAKTRFSTTSNMNILAMKHVNRDRLEAITQKWFRSDAVTGYEWMNEEAATRARSTGMNERMNGRGAGDAPGFIGAPHRCRIIIYCWLTTWHHGR